MVEEYITIDIGDEITQESKLNMPEIVTPTLSFEELVNIISNATDDQKQEFAELIAQQINQKSPQPNQNPNPNPTPTSNPNQNPNPTSPTPNQNSNPNPTPNPQSTPTPQPKPQPNPNTTPNQNQPTSAPTTQHTVDQKTDMLRPVLDKAFKSITDILSYQKTPRDAIIELTKLKQEYETKYNHVKVESSITIVDDSGEIVMEGLGDIIQKGRDWLNNTSVGQIVNNSKAGQAVETLSSLPSEIKHQKEVQTQLDNARYNDVFNVQYNSDWSYDYNNNDIIDYVNKELLPRANYTFNSIVKTAVDNHQNGFKNIYGLIGNIINKTIDKLKEKESTNGIRNDMTNENSFKQLATRHKYIINKLNIMVTALEKSEFVEDDPTLKALIDSIDKANEQYHDEYARFEYPDVHKTSPRNYPEIYKNAVNALTILEKSGEKLTDYYKRLLEFNKSQEAAANSNV